MDFTRRGSTWKHKNTMGADLETYLNSIDPSSIIQQALDRHQCIRLVVVIHIEKKYISLFNKVLRAGVNYDEIWNHIKTYPKLVPGKPKSLQIYTKNS